MTREMAIDAAWLVGGLAVVVSALAARRLPAARTAKLALIWIAIFASVTTLLTVTGVRWDG